MLCSTILTDIEDLGIYIKCLIIKLSLKVLIMTRRITVRVCPKNGWRKGENRSRHNANLRTTTS